MIIPLVIPTQEKVRLTDIQSIFFLKMTFEMDLLQQVNSLLYRDINYVIKSLQNSFVTDGPMDRLMDGPTE